MASMTLPALIMACSLSSYAGVNDTLYRIILTHSRGQLLYIQNPTTSLTYTPQTTARAVAMTDALVKANHKARVGLAGLDPVHLKRWRLSTKQAFDACTHIKLTSVVLETSMKKHKVLGAKNTTRLLKALAHYYDPTDPKALTTQDWAFMIMAMPKPSVAADLKKPKPGPLYQVTRSMQIFGKTRQKPTKWSLTTKKTKGTQKKTPSKPTKAVLPAGELAPYQKGGPLPPVTDRRL